MADITDIRRLKSELSGSRENSGSILEKTERRQLESKTLRIKTANHKQMETLSQETSNDALSILRYNKSQKAQISQYDINKLQNFRNDNNAHQKIIKNLSLQIKNNKTPGSKSFKEAIGAGLDIMQLMASKSYSKPDSKFFQCIEKFISKSSLAFAVNKYSIEKFFNSIQSNLPSNLKHIIAPQMSAKIAAFIVNYRDNIVINKNRALAALNKSTKSWEPGYEKEDEMITGFIKALDKVTSYPIISDAKALESKHYNNTVFHYKPPEAGQVRGFSVVPEDLSKSVHDQESGFLAMFNANKLPVSYLCWRNFLDNIETQGRIINEMSDSIVSNSGADACCKVANNAISRLKNQLESITKIPEIQSLLQNDKDGSLKDIIQSLRNILDVGQDPYLIKIKLRIKDLQEYLQDIIPSQARQSTVVANSISSGSWSKKITNPTMGDSLKQLDQEIQQNLEEINYRKEKLSTNAASETQELQNLNQALLKREELAQKKCNKVITGQPEALEFKIDAKGKVIGITGDVSFLQYGFPFFFQNPMRLGSGARLKEDATFLSFLNKKLNSSNPGLRENMNYFQNSKDGIVTDNALQQVLTMNLSEALNDIMSKMWSYSSANAKKNTQEVISNMASGGLFSARMMSTNRAIMSANSENSALLSKIVGRHNRMRDKHHKVETRGGQEARSTIEPVSPDIFGKATEVIMHGSDNTAHNISVMSHSNQILLECYNNGLLPSKPRDVNGCHHSTSGNMRDPEMEYKNNVILRQGHSGKVVKIDKFRHSLLSAKDEQIHVMSPGPNEKTQYVQDCVYSGFFTFANDEEAMKLIDRTGGISKSCKYMASYDFKKDSSGKIIMHQPDLTPAIQSKSPEFLDIVALLEGKRGMIIEHTDLRLSYDGKIKKAKREIRELEKAITETNKKISALEKAGQNVSEEDLLKKEQLTKKIEQANKAMETLKEEKSNFNKVKDQEVQEMHTAIEVSLQKFAKKALSMGKAGAEGRDAEIIIDPSKEETFNSVLGQIHDTLHIIRQGSTSMSHSLDTKIGQLHTKSFAQGRNRRNAISAAYLKDSEKMKKQLEKSWDANHSMSPVAHKSSTEEVTRKRPHTTETDKIPAKTRKIEPDNRITKRSQYMNDKESGIKHVTAPKPKKGQSSHISKLLNGLGSDTQRGR